jgi:hypothetical protein
MANLPHSYMSPSEICLRLAVAVAADVPWPVLEHCMPLRTPPCFLRHWARAFPTLHQGFYAWQLWDLFKQRLHVLIITTISEVQRAFFQAFRLSNNKWGFRSSPSTTQANFQPVHLQIKASSPQHRQYSLNDHFYEKRPSSHNSMGSTALASKTEANSPTATRGQGILEKNAVCNEIQLFVAQERSRPQLTAQFELWTFGETELRRCSSTPSHQQSSTQVQHGDDHLCSLGWRPKWASTRLHEQLPKPEHLDMAVVPIHCHHVSGTMGSYV